MWPGWIQILLTERQILHRGDKYSGDVDIGIMTRVGDSVRMTTSWHSMSPWHQSPVVSASTDSSYQHCYLWCQDHPKRALGATTNNKMRIRSWKQIVSSGRERRLGIKAGIIIAWVSLSSLYSIDHCVFDVVCLNPTLGARYTSNSDNPAIGIWRTND